MFMAASRHLGIREAVVRQPDNRQTERVDASAMGRGELGGQKADSKEGFEIILEERLHRLLDRLCRAKEFAHLAAGDMKQLYVAQS
jgi:hypothetical protein